MSSILKVDTIQDQNGNLIISKDSGGSGFLSPYASSSAAITYTVTVASKTSAHPYNGVGSSNGYFINGIESPIIEIKGNDTSKPYHYKFDQSDSSNSGHPLLFYNNVGKTTGFSTGVTTNGTPGQAGAYTMIAVDSQTPNILYYQCSSHANMGNHTFATSPVVNTGVFLTLPTADGSSGQVVTTNGSGVLSFANGSVPDDAITLAKMAPGTDGNIISYDTSGNPVAVATGNDGQVLTSAGAGAVPTFETLPAGTTLSGSTNNTVATVTGANALAGEANLTFDGTTLGVNGAAIFNESGADVDFRVESDGQENMLVVNGGLNRVGVGEDNPLGTLHVKTADSGATASADGDDLVIENGTSSGTAGMTFLSATNGYGSINFGDSDDNNIGIIDYEHSSNDMRISTNASEAMRINGTGNISIGSTDDYHNLHVVADGQTTDSWFSNGLTASCSGGWGGSKQVKVAWDFTSSLSYVLEFMIASYGQRQFFSVGSYTAGTSHQTTLLSGGSSDMTQSYASNKETWTAGGGTHGVYAVRLHSPQGINGALVTLI
mgnify:CR=1 FL=1